MSSISLSSTAFINAHPCLSSSFFHPLPINHDVSTRKRKSIQPARPDKNSRPLSLKPVTCTTANNNNNPTLSSLLLSSIPSSDIVSRSVVWFRMGDMRVQDHPGVFTARTQTRDTITYLFVCYVPEISTRTLAAARRLQAELNAPIHVRVVNSVEEEANAVIEFLRDVDAQRVHVCRDVNTTTQTAVNMVLLSNVVTQVHAWQPRTLHLPADEITLSDLKEMPDIFPKFERWRRQYVKNAAAARKKRNLIGDSDMQDDEEFILSSRMMMSTKEPDQKSSDDFLINNEKNGLQLLEEYVQQYEKNEDDNLREWREQFQDRFQSDYTLANALQSVNDHIDMKMVGWGEKRLRHFLQHAEVEHISDFGRSLAEIFRQGALSTHDINRIVREHEQQNGRIWRIFFRTAAKQVLRSLEAREFGHVLARRDVEGKMTVDGEHTARFWRWNGFLIRYIDENESKNDHLAPILLIHGFGASSFHYQKSVSVLKQHRRVLAIDLIGFGRSDKPFLRYTPAVWEAMVWDFVRTVVREPVYVAGNSIGGIFASGFGINAYPKLCVGVCLINTAGSMTETPLPSPPPPSSSTSSKSPLQKPNAGQGGLSKYVFNRWRWSRMIAGRFILRSLRGRVRRTLNAVYPTNPIPEESDLPGEILRASYDLGAVDVLASGIISPPSRTYQSLLANYTGPLLVFNGILDPLGNVKFRTKVFAQLYPQASVITVDAGHCPHDEVPDAFVEALIGWISRCENLDTETLPSGEQEREELSERVHPSNV